MAEYVPPLRDIRFVLEQLVDLDGLSKLGAYAHADPDTVLGVIEESGRFMAGVVGPLNQIGDTAGSTLDGDGNVTTPAGFREAYRQYVDAGWGAVPFSQEFGGGGFPWLVAVVMQEMMASADMAFSLCPLLTQGAIDMLAQYGSSVQQATFLERMVSGEWAGTMNLTEPQAGSDLGAVRAKAVPAEDGTWRVTGQKIFITYGEHDLAGNIIHLVLARVPDAPSGTRGISCFIVPKYLVNEDGSLGARNDLRCVSIEHKLGIHASPTCVMSYGDAGGATGYLIGEANQGMRYMFAMMNTARLSVGLQGLSLAERAYQDALRYAQERRQGRAVNAPPGEQSPIVEHPDVRRMLLTMKAYIEAMRALLYTNAVSIDLARHHSDQAERDAQRELADLLTPISRRGALILVWSSPRLAFRFTAAWATSRRPAWPSTCATYASPRSMRARTASRLSTSSPARCPCVAEQQWPTSWPRWTRSTRSWPPPARSCTRCGRRSLTGLARCGKQPAGSSPAVRSSPTMP